MIRVRYQSYDGVHWGELQGGSVQQLSGMMGSPTGHQVHLSEVTLLAPCEPRVIACVGKNYAQHVREMGGSSDDLPQEPGIFLKGLNTLRGPGDDIPYPSWTDDLQYEGELAVVVARSMRDVAPEDALSYVLGFTCAVDVTARDKQRSDMQWFRAKSGDGFCPVGPWLETDLEPGELRLRTLINGDTRQDASTSDMIFDVPNILSYLSRVVTLSPGDLVLTGTPDGVGRLSPGDRVEVVIDGIGTLENRVAAVQEG